jgi:PAS domain S-box-containing protein
MSDETTPQTPETTEPADLAEVALGVSAETLKRYEAIISRFLRGEYMSLDSEGRVNSWTRAAEERFGWSPSEMSGEDLAEALAVPEGQEATRASVEQIVRGAKEDGPAGGAFVLESRRRDGDRMKTEVALVPIRRGDGYHLNLALQDIVTHRGNPVEHHRMKKRHANVLRLIVTALDGGDLPAPLGDDAWQAEGERIEESWATAGALMIFDGSPWEVATAITPDAGAEATPLVATASAPAAVGSAPSSNEVDWLRSENERLRTELRAAQDEADKLRGVAPKTVRATEDADDPSIGAEDIEKALREDLFQLHGQPVLDLRTDEVAQHELLLRMIGPDGGLVMPQAFFGPARRAGLTGPIDRWVVRQAVRTIAEQAQVGRDIKLEVNLSAESLADPALIPTIERELTSTSIDPARLILEVPERVAIEDPDGASRLAKRLRAIGCSFALDDFGTSFGSFRFLKDLPVDFLKIDGDLIMSLSESRTAQLVVKALVDVAKGTGAETIAVFASDDDALRILREIGVGYAQGHKVGRPRPIAEALSAVEAAPLRAVDGEDQAAASGTAGTANLAT